MWYNEENRRAGCDGRGGDRERAVDPLGDILNSIRVSVPNWKDGAAFDSLLSFLCEYRDCVQQVAFFSSDFHPPQPLETAKEHAAILRERIRRVKEQGFSSGINVLSTLGHHTERLDEMVKGDWRRLTNVEGEECAGSFCPGDARYREEYVKPLYEIYAAAAPDFIWVDDDVRYGHFPVGNGCFCRECVARFNARSGTSYTREELKTALETPENTELRKEWLREQSEKIAELLRFVGRTVRAVDDGITLGFMTGERYFEGYDFALWADALSEDGAYEILWRPGGGAYSDRPFSSMVEKARQIGRQCARLPGNVTGIQSEIEDYPYRILFKSPRSTALEVLLYTAAGCTGAALNVLPNAPRGEPVEVMRGHFEALRRVIPFERLLSEKLGRAPSAGVWEGWHKDLQAALDGDFLSGGGSVFPDAWEELFSLGLPACSRLEDACCYLLTGRSPRALEEKELIRILSGGVYMDAEALDELNRMGYEDLTGFRVGKAFPEDSVEVYADHPLNAGIAGRTRLCPQVFVRGSSAELLPAPGAETLCFLEDHRGRRKAACSMGIRRNRLGGTVCVSSHYARSAFSDTLRSAEMKRLFRYLSGDGLPFLTESCVRLLASVRRTPQGDAVALLNPNFDVLENTAVLLGGDLQTAAITLEDGRRELLRARGRDGAMTRFVLPPLPPYAMALLERGE
ncbi:MAG: hypothetical protein IJM21_04840 [Clostridia bacterium]|nr:hypothetical protein [Clostridia bacterium]